MSKILQDFSGKLYIVHEAEELVIEDAKKLLEQFEGDLDQIRNFLFSAGALEPGTPAVAETEPGTPAVPEQPDQPANNGGVDDGHGQGQVNGDGQGTADPAPTTVDDGSAPAAPGADPNAAAPGSDTTPPTPPADAPQVTDPNVAAPAEPQQPPMM